MEKRIGVIAIIVTDKKNIIQLNTILSDYGEIIIGRLGLPIKEKAINVISLIVEGSNEQIGAMAGKIGKLYGIQVKSLLTKYRETKNAENNHSKSKGNRNLD